MLEDTFHKKFQPEELTAVLQRENESKACYERFLKHMQTHHYPSTLTLQMYMLFASHMNIGTPEILHFYQQMELKRPLLRNFTELIFSGCICCLTIRNITGIFQSVG